DLRHRPPCTGDAELLLNGSLLRKLLGVYPAKIRIYFIGVSSVPGSELTFPFADVKSAIV
ncbi:hypothetical protein, partial [Klebsiella pneumoniae]|uniref:hypothetical protein n=1 Tax=Klebsiella pneumoniae TaxID=573 RepID=UPI003969E99A